MTTANASARPGTKPTDRELEVLRAWAETGDMRGASARLGITVNSVDQALANVRSRAGVRHTWQAALAYGLTPRVGSS